MNEKRDENFYNSCSQTDFTYRYWVIIVYATKEEKYEFVPHEKCKFSMLYRRCASYVFNLCFVDEPLKTCDEKIKNEIYLPQHRCGVAISLTLYFRKEANYVLDNVFERAWSIVVVETLNQPSWLYTSCNYLTWLNFNGKQIQ